ncbi:MAG: hypothetical protein K2V38_28635, partial [Gemmataceae bacterium]|nr:hypothetical protein [Gemmataceae bacterium]
MPALRRLASRTLAAFTRLDRLFSLRDRRSVRFDRTRLEMTPLEERVVLDGTSVSLAWVSDAAEPGTAGAVRFTRVADPATIDTTSLTVRFRTSGLATVGSDFTLAGASATNPVAGQVVTVAFAPGQTTATVSVPVVDDALSEGWESVVVEPLPADPNSPLQTPYELATTDPLTVWIADDELWIEADATPAIRNQEVTFWLPEEGPEYTSVEWDPEYDGLTFHPAAGATDWQFAHTYDTTGQRTVAARATLMAGFTTVRDLGTEGAGY